MNGEQIDFLNFTLNIQQRVLNDVYEHYHNNNWNENFAELVKETEDKIIWDLENYYTLEEYEYSPINRVFKPDTEDIRKEIRERVTTIFNQYGKKLSTNTNK